MGAVRRSSRQRFKRSSVWQVVITLLAFFFISAGVSKFLDAGIPPGFPGHLGIVIGSIEIVGGLMILMPDLVTHGSVLLGLVVSGVVLSSLRHSEYHRLLPALAILIAVGAVGYFRRPGAVLRSKLLIAIDRFAEEESSRNSV